jgi:nitrate reductase gamma subunit
MTNVFVDWLTYAALTVFAVAVICRVVAYLRTPVHLRWELFPLPHEAGQARGGRSRLEVYEWWTKPSGHSLTGILGAMSLEMLFIRSLWENNRPLWYRSFPFHMGLYLLGAFLGLLGIGAVAQVAGTAVGADAGLSAARGLHYLTAGVGYLGLAAAIVGTMALLHRRLTDEEIKRYTTSADLFNLGFILVVLLLGLIVSLAADRGFGQARDMAAGLLSFKRATPGSGWVALEVVATALLIAYIPCTHMSHFFMKFFTYHDVRWEDEPNAAGSRIEARTAKALQYPVTWSAPHVKGDGRKTWHDAATKE